jgi:hypothetical protein
MANCPGVSVVSFRLVFAADAEADGCAVSKSNGFVSSVVREAEGIWVVNLADSWYRVLGMLQPIGLTSGLACTCTAQSANDSTPTVTLTFDTAASGSDVDPDGLTLDLALLVKNSSAGEGV